MKKTVHVMLLIVFAACSSAPQPEGILLPKKMKKVVSEMIQVDEYISNFLSSDTAIKKKRSMLYEQVFKMNNTTRTAFYTSFKYYQQHPDIQKGLFDSLYEEVNNRPDEKPKPLPAKNAR